MQFWSEFFASPEIINWITRHSGSNICVWMIIITPSIYFLHLHSSILVASDLDLLMVVQKLGLYGLLGSTCHSSSPVFGWSFSLCLFPFLHGSISLHTILIWICCSYSRKLELYGLASGPLFPRHGGSFSVAQQYFLLKIIIISHQTSFLCLSLSILSSCRHRLGRDIIGTGAVYLTFPDKTFLITFTSSFEACFSWA